MFQQILNWRTGLAAIAILIVSGTIVYSQYLARKIAKEEREKVELWVEASKSLLNPNVEDIRLPFRIISQNDDIPIIETNEHDSITNYVNIDTARVRSEPGYLAEKLQSLKSINDPILYYDPIDSSKINRYYFGHTSLLNEVRYYPIVQLFIIGLFIIVTLTALRSSYRSTQNQVWAGMAKETAHQLGTPVSSLEGWVEMLREKMGDDKIVSELGKDVDRLRLVSDRFGKIGSTPQLEEADLVKQIGNMVDYIRKRAPGKINIHVDTHGLKEVRGRIHRRCSTG
jgi:hypothetical protein